MQQKLQIRRIVALFLVLTMVLSTLSGAGPITSDCNEANSDANIFALNADNTDYVTVESPVVVQGAAAEEEAVCTNPTLAVVWQPTLQDTPNIGNLNAHGGNGIRRNSSNGHLAVVGGNIHFSPDDVMARQININVNEGGFLPSAGGTYRIAFNAMVFTSGGALENDAFIVVTNDETPEMKRTTFEVTDESPTVISLDWVQSAVPETSGNNTLGRLRLEAAAAAGTERQTIAISNLRFYSVEYCGECEACLAKRQTLAQAETAVNEVLNAINPTNEVTAVQIQTAVEAVLESHIERTVTVDITEAAPGMPGTIAIKVTLSVGEETLEIEKNIEIPAPQSLADAKAAVEALLANLQVTNETTVAQIQAAIVNVVQSHITLTWFEEVVITPAVVGENGSVKGIVVLALGGAEETITIDLEIDASLVRGEKVLFDLQTADEEVLENLNNDTGGLGPDAIAALKYVSVTGSDTMRVTFVPGEQRSVTVTGRGGTGQGVRFRLAGIDTALEHDYRFEATGFFPGTPTEAQATARFRAESGTVAGLPITVPPGEGNTFVISHILTAAQVTAAGTAQISIGNNSGNVDMTYTGIRLVQICPLGCECALDGPQSLLGAATAARTAILGINPSNDVTAEAVTAIVEDAIEEHITVTWTAPVVVTLATPGEAGSIKGTAQLSLNGETEDVVIDLVILALPDGCSLATLYDLQEDDTLTALTNETVATHSLFRAPAGGVLSGVDKTSVLLANREGNSNGIDISLEKLITMLNPGHEYRFEIVGSATVASSSGSAARFNRPGTGTFGTINHATSSTGDGGAFSFGVVLPYETIQEHATDGGTRTYRIGTNSGDTNTQNLSISELRIIQLCNNPDCPNCATPQFGFIFELQKHIAGMPNGPFTSTDHLRVTHPNETVVNLSIVDAETTPYIVVERTGTNQTRGLFLEGIDYKAGDIITLRGNLLTAGVEMRLQENPSNDMPSHAELNYTGGQEQGPFTIRYTVTESFVAGTSNGVRILAHGASIPATFRLTDLTVFRPDPNERMREPFSWGESGGPPLHSANSSQTPGGSLVTWVHGNENSDADTPAVLRFSEVVVTEEDKDLLRKAVAAELILYSPEGGQRRNFIWTDLSGAVEGVVGDPNLGDIVVEKEVTVDIPFFRDVNSEVGALLTTTNLQPITVEIPIHLLYLPATDTEPERFAQHIYVLGTLGSHDGATNIEGLNTPGGLRTNVTRAITRAVLTPKEEMSFATNISLNYGVDETEMRITWWTASGTAEAAVLQYHKVSDEVVFSTEAAITITGTQDFTLTELGLAAYAFDVNRATITGLDANTKWAYRVGDGGENWSDVHYFETFDPKNGHTLMLAGDPQIGAWNLARQYNKWRLGIDAAVNRAAIIAEESGRGHGGIDFIMNQGDNVTPANSIERMHVYMAPERLRNIPMFTTIGNHDTISQGNAPLPQNLSMMSLVHDWPNHDWLGGSPTSLENERRGGGNHYFVYGDVLYISLNTNVNDREAHRKTLLDAVEAHPDTTWRIVQFHHDIFGNGTGHAAGMPGSSRQTMLYDFLHEDIKIDLVINGHEHTHSRSHFLTSRNMDKGDGIIPAGVEIDQYPANFAANREGRLVYDDNPGAFIAPKGIPFITTGSVSDFPKYSSIQPMLPWAAWTDPAQYDNYSQYSIMLVDGDSITIETWVIPYDTQTWEPTGEPEFLSNSITIRKTARYEDLELLRTGVVALQQNEVTQATWNNFQASITAAQSITADSSAEAIHKAYMDIYEAYYALENPVNRDALHPLVLEVRAFLEVAVEGPWEGMYPTGSLTTMTAIFLDAEHVNFKKLSTQADIDEQFSLLSTAYTALLASVSTIARPWVDVHEIPANETVEVGLTNWMLDTRPGTLVPIMIGMPWEAHDNVTPRFLAHHTKVDFAGGSLRGGPHTTSSNNTVPNSHHTIRVPTQFPDTVIRPDIPFGPATASGGRSPIPYVDIAAGTSDVIYGHVTKTHAGEWIRYELNVAQAGMYEVKLGAINNNSGHTRVLLRDTNYNILTSFFIPGNHGVEQGWTAENPLIDAANNIYLPQGNFVLEMVFVNDGLDNNLTVPRHGGATHHGSGNVSSYPDGANVDILTFRRVGDGTPPNFKLPDNHYLLPLPPNLSAGNALRQRGWGTPGSTFEFGRVADDDNSLSLRAVSMATHVVFDVAGRPSGNVDVVLAGGAAGDWNQNSMQMADIYTYDAETGLGKVTIDLSRVVQNNTATRITYDLWRAVEDELPRRFIVSHNSESWDELNVIRAYLILDGPYDELVVPTGLTATTPTTVVVNVGNTVNIGVDKTPENWNVEGYEVEWDVDSQVVTTSGAGLNLAVTGVTLGVAEITAQLVSPAAIGVDRNVGSPVTFNVMVMDDIEVNADFNENVNRTSNDKFDTIVRDAEGNFIAVIEYDVEVMAADGTITVTVTVEDGLPQGIDKHDFGFNINLAFNVGGSNNVNVPIHVEIPFDNGTSNGIDLTNEAITNAWSDFIGTTAGVQAVAQARGETPETLDLEDVMNNLEIVGALITPTSEEKEEVERMRNIILGLVALFSMTVAANAQVVPRGEEFVTPETMNALIEAFDALEFVTYGDLTDVDTWDLSAMNNVSFDTLQQAITDLNEAIRIFKDARKLGTGELVAPDAFTSNREVILHLRGENLSEGRNLETNPVTGFAPSGAPVTEVAVNFYGGVTINVPAGPDPWEHWRGLDIQPFVEGEGEDDDFEILAGDRLRIRIRNTGESQNTISVQADDRDPVTTMGTLVVPAGETRDITITITEDHLEAARTDDSQYAHNNFRIRGSVIGTTWEIADVMIDRGQATMFNVEFNLNGGTRTGGGELTQQIEEGEPATPPTVTRDGWTHTGWVSSPAGIAMDNITANVTFTAQWTEGGGDCNCGFDSHVLGDINGDGTADFGDMTAMRLFIAGEQAFPSSAAQWQFAAAGRHGRIGQTLKALNPEITCNCGFGDHVLGDINGDGTADFGDMTAMRLFIAGEQAFPSSAAQWQFAAAGRHGRINVQLKDLPVFAPLHSQNQ